MEKKNEKKEKKMKKKEKEKKEKKEQGLKKVVFFLNVVSRQ